MVSWVISRITRYFTMQALGVVLVIDDGIEQSAAEPIWLFVDRPVGAVHRNSTSISSSWPGADGTRHCFAQSSGQHGWLDRWSAAVRTWTLTTARGRYSW